MDSSRSRGMAPFRVLLFLAASKAPLVTAQVMLNLCADYNTADTSRNTSIYQTNGLCTDFCREDYAYAITQENSCWCSNYTPHDDTQVDLDDCSINCPAYPIEKCGGRGLFGYVELNGHLPSGTKGGDDDQATSTTTSTIPTPTIITATVTETETVQNPVESETSSEEETSTTTSSTTTTSSSSSAEESTTEAEESAEPTKIETITTANGAILTITITPEPTGADESEGENGGSGGGGLGTGGIVGVVIGVVGGILVAAGLGLWWFMRRRKQDREEGYQEDPSVRGSSSSRMGGSVNPDMASAGSPGSGTHGSNRNSTLQIDPRMDPFKQGLYARAGSHESINTLRDDHDYSRRILRATNPDPSTAET